MDDIRAQAKAAKNFESEFIDTVVSLKLKKQKEQCSKNVKNIEKAKARLAELENIIKCLYEDKVCLLYTSTATDENQNFSLYIIVSFI